MHDILGIVQDDRLGPKPLCRNVALERVPKRVETIGLGRRAIARADDQTDPVIAFGHIGRRRDGGRVIGLEPDIQAIIGMSESCERGGQHRADHRRLVPGRGEDDHASRLSGFG